MNITEILAALKATLEPKILEELGKVNTVITDAIPKLEQTLADAGKVVQDFNDIMATLKGLIPNA
jgi:hypothetical protein